MDDMSSVIAPKSDQLNADDLITDPLTVTITGVDIRPGTEQPVSVHFEGDSNKPYKPCKSMARVMVKAWGADAKKYIGQSMTLYRDDKVMWGGMAVGGIRISHMTGIPGEQAMMLTESKKSRKLFTVRPLVMEKAATTQAKPKGRTFDDWLADIQSRMADATTQADVDEVTGDPEVRKIVVRLKEPDLGRYNAAVSAELARTASSPQPPITDSEVPF